MTTLTKVRWTDRLNGHVHEDVVREGDDFDRLTDDPDVIVLAFEDVEEQDTTEEGG